MSYEERRRLGDELEKVRQNIKVYRVYGKVPPESVLLYICAKADLCWPVAAGRIVFFGPEAGVFKALTIRFYIERAE